MAPDGIAVAITVRATHVGTSRHGEQISRGSNRVQFVCNQKDLVNLDCYMLLICSEIDPEDVT